MGEKGLSDEGLSEFMMGEFLLNPGIQADFVRGFGVTCQISAISASFALFIGFWMAFARLSVQRWLRGCASAYVAFFRNTPLLIQLYIFYRGLQSIGIVLEPLTCGVLALSLYSGAYMTEIFRSGLLAVPKEQLDAGLSLGLTRLQVYKLVLIPQAVRLVLPTVGNQLIALTKNSALVAFITVSDLFLVIYKGAVDQFRPMEFFIEGALWYLLLSWGISAGVGLVGRLLECQSSGGVAHAAR